MRVNAYLPSLTLTASEDERTVRGVAVPWNVWGHTSAGPVSFARGSLPTDRLPPLLLHHDTTRPVGVLTAAEDTEQGLTFTARLSDTTDGRDALTLARDRALTGVSVGVDITAYDEGKDGLHVTPRTGPNCRS